MPEKLYSMYQVADVLGAASSEVLEWVRRGWLRAQAHEDGEWRISEGALKQFLDERGANLETALAKAALQRDQGPAAGSYAPEDPASSPKNVSSSPPASPQAGAEMSIRQVVEAILGDAIQRGAESIHLEPSTEGLGLRLRVDGVLHEKANFRLRLPRSIAPKLIEQFKQLAALRLEEVRLPQSGTFSIKLPEGARRFHMATLPTLHGERLVLRREDLPAPAAGLAEAGLSPAAEAAMRNALREPSGLVLAIGRPGAARTATLQAMASCLDLAPTSAVAMDRRHRLHLPHLSIANLPDSGFAKLPQFIQSLVEQDVDTIVLEEIPNPATATEVMDAVGDGRRVLAGINAPNIPAALALLLDMGVDAYVLASSLLLAASQVLVRKVCQACRQPVQPTDDLLQALGLCRQEIDFPVFAGGGCPKCFHTGCAGRTGLFEVLAVDEAVSRIIRRGWIVPGQALQTQPVSSLRQDALEKARSGLVSLQELARVMPARLVKSQPSP